MSAKKQGCFNEVIDLDSSNDSDIIPCSIHETDKNVSKTPRSNIKRACVKNKTKCMTVSLKGFQYTNENSQIKNSGYDKLNTSLQWKLRQRIDLDNTYANNNVKSTPRNSTNEKNSAHPIMNKLLSSVKKTPNFHYLSEAKLQSVEKWLLENDFETAQIYPLVNPYEKNLRPRKKCSTLTTSNTTPSKKNRRISSDNSSINSEVERVLKAVYGDDWKSQNVIKKCKTDPKRSKAKISFPKDQLCSASNEQTMRRVRRNILKQNIPEQSLIAKEKTDHLDVSFSSGIKKLNESQPDIEIVMEKKRKKVSQFSSSDSWKPSSNKKTKMKTKKKKIGRRIENETPMNNIITKEDSRNAKTPKTFLASLSVLTPRSRCHPEAQLFKINFKTKKHDLAKRLFQIYNNEVFDNQLPEDMSITWNVKLRGTAGYCYNKRITKSTGQIIRASRIEFSTKIIDRADRLRDTMIHELCHAASWVIDGALDGHGSFWTKWANKAMKTFPELPLIRRCHSYEIASKYTYKCTGCGYSINRHSKSINIERKRCGHCFGVLELFVNKKRRGKNEVPEFDSTRTIPPPNNFAMFVKENYHNVKSMKTNIKHAEIMKVLSQQYALVKNSGISVVDIK